MFTHRLVGRGGSAMGANVPPPPPHGPKRSAWKGPKMILRKKKRQRWIFSSNFINARNFSQCRKETRGCWSLITVFMLLIYLPRPINSRNTIMRKGRLVVVILGSMFLKTLKVRSQVKDLLNTSILNYLHCDYLTYIHTLLVVSTTSCYSWAQNNGRPAVKVRPKMRKWPVKLRTFETFVQIIDPFIWRKLVPGRRVKSCPFDRTKAN